jgi:hypothetical protein
MLTLSSGGGGGTLVGIYAGNTLTYSVAYRFSDCRDLIATFSSASDGSTPGSGIPSEVATIELFGLDCCDADDSTPPPECQCDPDPGPISFTFPAVDFSGVRRPQLPRRLGDTGLPGGLPVVRGGRDELHGGRRHGRRQRVHRELEHAGRLRDLQRNVGVLRRLLRTHQRQPARGVADQRRVLRRSVMECTHVPGQSLSGCRHCKLVAKMPALVTAAKEHGKAAALDQLRAEMMPREPGIIQKAPVSPGRSCATSPPAARE